MAGRLVRTRARLLLWTAGIAFALCLLLPQAEEARHAVQTLRFVEWDWLLAAATGSALIYLTAAWAQMGAVERSLGLRDTVVVQVAATFVAQVTPQGLGGMGVNGRYLERQGLTRAAAAGAVTLNMAAGAVVHTLALAVAFSLLGRGALGNLSARDGWTVVLAILTLIGVVVALLRWPTGRSRVIASAVGAIQEMTRVLRRPIRALQLFGGSAGVTASYTLTLALCLRSFGITISPLEIAAVYLGGAAVGALIPTPGGLGAIEVALAGGLTAAGVELGPAVAAVSTFRLLTFWLPIVPGFLSFRYLRRRSVL